jgi:hypothetical protein
MSGATVIDFCEQRHLRHAAQWCDTLVTLGDLARARGDHAFQSDVLRALLVLQSNINAQLRRVPNTDEEVLMAANDLDEIRELATACDKHAAALGVAVRDLHVKLTEARMRVGRGPSGLLVHSALERCTRLYLGNNVMRGLPGSPRLPMQTGFKATVEKWLPSLSPPKPPPTTPPPPPPHQAA